MNIYFEWALVRRYLVASSMNQSKQQDIVQKFNSIRGEQDY